MKSITLLLLSTLWSNTVHSFTLPNTNAKYQNSPQPFEIQVDPSFIHDVHQRVAHARAPIPVRGTVPSQGPPLSNFTTVQKYWVDEYDWNSTQAHINKELKQFTTIVHPANSSYGSAVPLHFVHHVSPRKDAIPLLFIHGWPGSFLEVTKIIGPLTNPPNSSVPAFHVVAPSIPGFGFSPAPDHVGFGPTEAAQSFNALMQQLNYPKYVIQGGDFGGEILRYQANLFPEQVVSVLANFWPVNPNATDMHRYHHGETTEDETRYIENLENYYVNNSGYRYIAQHQPLTVTYALTDSPIGFAMYIYGLMTMAVDPTDFSWTPQEIITWSMMYTIQGPYGGVRLYLEMLNEGALNKRFGFGTPPFVPQPAAISEFPYDIWFDLPLSWAQRDGNVKVRNVHSKGGHFAAYEVPHLLLGDIWRWFGDAQLSGTSAFGKSNH